MHSYPPNFIASAGWPEVGSQLSSAYSLWGPKCFVKNGLKSKKTIIDFE
jgi:hypothetical protein